MRTARLGLTALPLLVIFAAAACGDDSSADDDDDDDIDGGNLGPDASPAPFCTPTAGTDLHLVPIVTDGLERPVLVTAPPGDARLFIVEQPGRIRIVEDGLLVAEPFLDITDRVKALGDEQGLLGLAFHPDYATNGQFFVHYNVMDSQDTQVSRFTVSGDPDIANDDEHEIIHIDRFTADNHNGGMIEFNLDGFLYIATGDGGAGDNFYETAQDPDLLNAKILRLDVDGGDPYAIPDGNPFVGGPGADEVFAMGLRNPWRFSFDAANGNMYIGDVGQGQREEVDYVELGDGSRNFGWSVYEGTLCYNAGAGGPCEGDFDAPIVDYDRTGPESRASVIGGYVYRGTCMPDMVGTYIFGDYGSGEFFSFVPENGVATEEDFETLSENIDPDGVFFQVMVSFGEDAFQEIYVVAANGDIYRIEAE